MYSKPLGAEDSESRSTESRANATGCPLRNGASKRTRRLQHLYLVTFNKLSGNEAGSTEIHVFPKLRLAVCSFPSYNTPPSEALMPFILRPYRRFPVTYNAGPFQG